MKIKQKIILKMSKLKVRKRDGSIQDFDINKIRKVVKDAFNTTKETVDDLDEKLDQIKE